MSLENGSQCVPSSEAVEPSDWEEEHWEGLMDTPVQGSKVLSFPDYFPNEKISRGNSLARMIMRAGASTGGRAFIFHTACPGLIPARVIPELGLTPKQKKANKIKQPKQTEKKRRIWVWGHKDSSES